MSFVAFAGPLSNFVVAFILGLVFRFDLLPVVLHTRGISSPEEILGFAAFLAIFFNLILGIFNLIPLPPLDGSKVLGGLLPRAPLRTLPPLRAVRLDSVDRADRSQSHPQLRIRHQLPGTDIAPAGTVHVPVGYRR